MHILSATASFLLLPILGLAKDLTITISSESTTATPSTTPDPIASLLSAGFVPLTSFTPSTLAPSPSVVPSENSNHLDLREIVNGAPAAQPPSVVTQQSPVTTVQINGALLVYTQLFTSVPDPLPGPKKGSIGLGTIQGKVGDAKRDTVETAKANVIEKRDGSGAERGRRTTATGLLMGLGTAVVALVL